MTFDDATFYVWLAILPVWFVWELVLLWKRGQGVHVRTISMVAQRRGWQLPAVVFFFSSQPVHWWVPIGWGAAWAAVVFWVLIVALLVWNIARWKKTARPLAEWPRWERWFNFPAWYVAGGAIAAALLFPQGGPTPWSP